jgi:tetratricopeptide (TPR) repeat protein
MVRRETLRRAAVIAAVAIGLVGVGAGLWWLNRAATNDAKATKVKAEAEQLLDRQNYNAAVGPLRELARLRPDSPGVFPDLGRSVMQASNHPTLIREAVAELARDPNDPVALMVAASALIGRDDERKRMDYLRRLLRLRPQETVVREQLAQDLVNDFRFDEARPHLDTLMKAAPDDPAAYYLRGQTAFYATPTPEGLAQAAADFEKALELNPRLARAHLYLGRVYRRMGKPREAIEELTQAAQTMPANADVHFELASAFRAVGDAAMAAQAQAAFVHLREQALRTEGLVKKCGAFPNDFALHLEAARQLIQKGDLEKAIYYVNRALTLRPDDPQAAATAKELDTLLTAGGGR